MSVQELSLRDLFQAKPENIGCLSMLNSYCGHLYSPEARGNIKIGKASDSPLITQGKTSNDFSGVYFAYASAKIASESLLPTDFREALKKHQYFTKLKQFLSREPREQMTLAKRLKAIQLEHELDAIWSAAISETIIRRLDRKYPGFHRLKDEAIPIEAQVEKRRENRELISEISRAIWKKNKNWQKVQEAFNDLRSRFTAVIDALDIPETIRRDWLSKILAVRLVIPGAIPEISDTECSSTQINAYYYPRLNYLTVCAGDFNSEDVLETMAHELSHALDIDRARYLFQSGSTFGNSLSSLRQQVCAPEIFSCASWDGFRKQFTENLNALSQYHVELPDFQRCLKRHATDKIIENADIDRLAEQAIKEKLEGLAESDLFLRITKDKVPLLSGKSIKNPNFLNPCNYYLWSKGEEPIDDELTQLLFFTAEYRCSSDSSPMGKFKKSIEVSRELALQVEKAVLKMEGEFSPRPLLEREAFSSPPNERFADVLGSYVLASQLSQVPSQWKRREVFLASSSWQCSEPSLATQFPEESKIEHEFVMDAHTDGDDRKKEFFSTPLREIVGCQQDFLFKTCELPFKTQAPFNTPLDKAAYIGREK